MQSTSSKQRDVVEKAVHLKASPEMIFAFLTDARKMRRWKGVGGLDAKPGGVFEVEMNGSDVAKGEFKVVEPYRRVVFTWGWVGSPLAPGSTTAEMTLPPEAGGTLLRL